MSYTNAELATLVYFLGLKPFARAEYMERAGLGSYGAENAHIAGLIGKGVIKANKAGALTIDRGKALAALAAHERPAGYNFSGVNAYGYFRGETDSYTKR